MSDGARIPLAEATEMANAIVTMLRSCCERIEIAGSIRRKCDTVGDIEIVCVPKIEPGQPDMFGDATSDSNLLDIEIATLLGCAGAIAHRLDKNGRRSCGPRYKRLTYNGFPLDLFSVLPPAQWGVIMAIRTGPAEFSKRLVTAQPFGWMPVTNRVRDGVLWRVDPADVSAFLNVIDTPEEKDFFAAIGLDWIAPEDRRG